MRVSIGRVCASRTRVFSVIFSVVYRSSRATPQPTSSSTTAPRIDGRYSRIWNATRLTDSASVAVHSCSSKIVFWFSMAGIIGCKSRQPQPGSRMPHAGLTRRICWRDVKHAGSRFRMGSGRPAGWAGRPGGRESSGMHAACGTVARCGPSQVMAGARVSASVHAAIGRP